MCERAQAIKREQKQSLESESNRQERAIVKREQKQSLESESNR